MLNKKNKTKIVTVRFTETELNQLDRRAKNVNLTRSAYITQILKGKPISPSIVPPVNWKLYGELHY